MRVYDKKLYGSDDARVVSCFERVRSNFSKCPTRNNRAIFAANELSGSITSSKAPESRRMTPNLGSG